MQENFVRNTEFEKRVGSSVRTDAPRVSIITPAYNIAGFIAETLDSIFAQTCQNFEVIVVNDGSPDTIEFEEVLKPYFDEIIYIKTINRGAGAARNLAIEHSRGELLAFLDGDDVWFPEFLKSQVEFLEKNKFDLVYCDAVLFGSAVLKGKNYMLDAPSTGAADFESLLDLRCSVITSGTIARKKNVLQAGMFETEKVRAHDFVLWLKMAHGGAHIGYQTKILLKYRVRNDSLSGDATQQIEREIDVFKRVSKQINLNENQRQIVKKQLQRLEAALEVERGKSFLRLNDFAAARKAFVKANEYSRSNRLRLIIWLAKFAPKLLLKIYSSRRADHINFVPEDAK